MLILSPADRAALWHQTITSEADERPGMRRVLAKEMQDLVVEELEIYAGLDEQFERTLELLDASGFIGRDELRRAFEVVGLDEPESGLSAAEFVLLLAFYLEESAGLERLDKETRLEALHVATAWRHIVETEQSVEQPQETLSVADVAAHFEVTPQAVYKWCEAGKIEFERTPGGSYRIPAGQFDWARGQDTRQKRREIAERLLARYGDKPPMSEEEMVAEIRKARRESPGG
jgi:excisionase family DNA binding protein